MVLYVGESGNVPMTFVPSSVEAFLKSSKWIEQEANVFKGTSPKKLKADEGVLYVNQSEFAMSHPGDPNVSILGSEDATTCHILVLRESRTHVTALAHMDSGHGVSRMVDKLARISNNRTKETNNKQLRLEVSLIGGYEDEAGTSEGLTLKLLGDFVDSEVHFTLKLCVIGSLNTTYDQNCDPWPMHYGCAVDVGTGEIFPANFQDHGPADTLRHCRISFNNNRAQLRPFDLYDCESGEILIEPFTFAYNPGLEFWLRAPSKLILENMSSSPKVEPVYFVPKLKQTIQMVLDHPNAIKTIFRGLKPLCFTRHPSTGQWEPKGE
eukprot:maker-scaffold64_size435223-snap-gene-2.23 protein:Tk02487 transcript:maker-scaffold64_size435223-snap-gene-2.23-mRNA-1 annotation:"protein n-terminal asparagine amidohydrolase"